MTPCNLPQPNYKINPEPYRMWKKFNLTNSIVLLETECEDCDEDENRMCKPANYTSDTPATCVCALGYTERNGECIGRNYDIF